MGSLDVEVRRFGVGHRRPEGPAQSSGVEGAVIHSDARGLIAELAFRPGGRIEPHTNPNTTWLVVVEGGGWVLVGSERRPIMAGEAALWPAGELHAAGAEHLPMRAFVVEFSGADDAHLRELLDGTARQLAPGEPRPARGNGALAPRPPDPRVPRDGEPG